MKYIALLLISASSLFAFAGGSGKSYDPYLVETAADFLKLNTQGFENLHYRQVADLDLGTTNSTVIQNSFGGVYDGNGYTITFIGNNPTWTMGGLFSQILGNGIVRNLHVQADLTLKNGLDAPPELTERSFSSLVLGTNRMGGLLVGDNMGLIENCSSSGKIQGTHGMLGGLVGRNYSKIHKSHSNAAVLLQGSGEAAMGHMSMGGGLVGMNNGTITMSYTEGNVASEATTTGAAMYVMGGLVGFHFIGLIENSYFAGSIQNNASGTGTQYRMGGLVGTIENYSEIMNSTIRQSYASAEWIGSLTGAGGLVGNYISGTIESSFWNTNTQLVITSPGSPDTDGFDMLVFSSDLRWSVWPDSIWFKRSSQPPLHNRFEGGDGTDLNPYRVATKQQLQIVSDCLSCHYKQVADITFSGELFTPIGTSAFTGSFDGNGYTIKGLKITYSLGDQVGLFAHNAGVLQNITLLNVDISTTRDRVGAIAGYNSATGIVENCKVEMGQVKGNTSVGGLVGLNEGVIRWGYSMVSVNAANSYAGGIAGETQNSASVVEYSQAHGVVHATNNCAGGLIGETSSGKVNQSFSTGTVSCESCYNSVGGFIGRTSGYATITNSYWAVDSSYQATSAGLTADYGKTTSQLRSRLTYTNWSFDSLWSLDAKANNGFPVKHRYGGGLGTEAKPYRIQTVEHLDHVRTAMDRYFVQEADLDFSQSPRVKDTTWKCIGGDLDYFAGNYDGQDFTIRNFGLQQLLLPNVPGSIFCTIGDLGAIHNVKISNAKVETNDKSSALATWNFGAIRHVELSQSNLTGTDTTGGVVAINRGVMEDITATSVTVKGSIAAGGVAGANFQTIDQATIQQIKVNGSSNLGALTGVNNGAISDIQGNQLRLNGTSRVGGVVGQNLEEGSLSNFRVVFVWDTASEYAGGIVGENAGVMTYLLADSLHVTASSNSAGGIVGLNMGIVSQAGASGEINGGESIGGVTGVNGGIAQEVYYVGIVQAGNSIGGGIQGQGLDASSLSDCYVKGRVEANMLAGGISGIQNGVLQRCYAMTELEVSISNTKGPVSASRGSSAQVSVTFFANDLSGSAMANETGTTGLSSLEMSNPTHYGLFSKDIWVHDVNFKINTPLLLWRYPALQVKPTRLEVVYGSTIPALTYSIVSGDTLNAGSVWSGAPVRSDIFNNKVGSYPILQGSLSNSVFPLVWVPETLWIAPKALSFSKLAIKTKVYDKTTTGELDSYELAGVHCWTQGLDCVADEVGIENLQLSFVSANASDQAAFTWTASLTGKDKDNYLLVDNTPRHGIILPKELQIVNGQGVSRVYDGTDTVRVNGTLTGVLDGDDVTLDHLKGRFATRHVGTQKAIEVFEEFWSGADKANYAIAMPEGLTADVTPKPATLSGLAVVERNYDGTKNANMIATTFTGLVNLDDVIWDTAAVTYANANVGNAKDITVAKGFSLSGMDAANYELQPLGSLPTGKVTPAPLTITAVDTSKVVGSADPKFRVTYSGFQGADDASLVTFLSITRSKGDTVGQYVISPSGAVASNYVISYVKGKFEILSDGTPIRPTQFTKAWHWQVAEGMLIVEGLNQPAVLLDVTGRRIHSLPAQAFQRIPVRNGVYYLQQGKNVERITVHP